MNILVKTLAGVSAVLFVLTGAAALLLFNIEQRAFSSEPYKRAFEKQNLYERIPKALASVFAASLAGNENANSAFKSLTVDDWETSIALLLPPDELKKVTDAGLDSIFAYLDGSADSAALTLAPLKENLSGPAGMDALLQILRSQPNCTNEQLVQMTLAALSGKGFTFCNPPAGLVELVRPLIQSQISIVASALPDEVTLISGDQSGTVNDPRLRLNRIRTVMKVSPILPILLLLGLTIFAVRSPKDWLNWWGWSFLAIGVLVLPIAFLGAPILSGLIQIAIQTQHSLAISPLLLPYLLQTTSLTARQILNPVLLQAIILVMFGFGMVLAAFILSRKKSPA